MPRADLPLEEPLTTIARPLAASLGAALALLAAPALAQQPPEQQADEAMQGGGMTEERDLSDEQARLHFRAGRGLYDAGRFAQAAAEFEEAFRLSQRPELLFNAYVAYRDANDLEGAVRSLRAYLEQAEDVADRVNLTARLESMTQALEDRRAREVEVEEQRRRADAAQPQASGPEVWPWIVMGAGAAVVIGGVAAGAVALSETDALVAECPGGQCGASVDLDGRRESVRALAITADVLLFGGGAIAVAGLVLGIVLNSGGTPAETAPEVSAGCSPTGCGATLRTRF